MTEVPNIIVEGIDDVKFYADLSRSINKKTEVFAVENISNYAEGSSCVIQAMEELANLIGPRTEYYKYVLGIIDRDARYYRGEIPENLNDLLLVLNFYSYESHFVTKETIKKVISLLTNAQLNLLENATSVSLIESNLINNVDKLYYCSLEALKSACDSNYEGIVGYSINAGRIINDESLINQVFFKKDDLDEYANQQSLSRNDIKLIAKGKWLLHWFLENLLNEIDNLPQLCQAGVITICQYCNAQKYNKCLYKKTSSWNVSQLKKFVFQLYDEPSLDYIKDRIKDLYSIEPSY